MMMGEAWACVPKIAPPLVEGSDIIAASERLRQWVKETPLTSIPSLDDELGVRTYLKLECEQHTGSFKLRGCMNRLLALKPHERDLGLVAASSGNHGIALAYGARAIGTNAVVVMPSDGSSYKRSRIEELGARVVEFDRSRSNRADTVDKIVETEGRVSIDSSNSALVIAGAGTVGLELSRQGEVSAVVAPVGGGGLAAGCAVGLSHLAPHVPVYGVEPEGADDTARSLERGSRVSIAAASTIADGLRHASPERETFLLNREHLRGVLVVGDSDIIRAMRLLWHIGGIKTEPSGACALAAVLKFGHLFEGTSVGVVLSGGNIAWDEFRDLVAEPAGVESAGASIMG